jgi:hypothetical protein
MAEADTSEVPGFEYLYANCLRLIRSMTTVPRSVQVSTPTEILSLNRDLHWPILIGLHRPLHFSEGYSIKYRFPRTVNRIVQVSFVSI